MNNDTLLNERVEVIATFNFGHLLCRPVKFRRKSGREVIVSEIGLGFPLARGSKMVHIFDVTDGQADYRLEFDAERLTWRLTREADRE